MKFKIFYLSLISLLFIACSGKNNITPEFKELAQGRYLFNADETIEVYFENDKLLLKWRGANKIEPMTMGENQFFIKEMNEKIEFLKNPGDNKVYMCLIPKEKGTKKSFNFKKLNDDEDVPSNYLKKKNYTKALEGYMALKEKDTTENFINEWNFNKLGYEKMRAKEYNEAIEIFKINTVLFPKSDNVYDSLADAYSKSGDTLKAIENYKKAIAIDSGNRRAKKYIKKYDK